jgi:uncharacterized protein
MIGAPANRLPAHRATMCIYIVRYEWDDRKNELNQRRHGVSFELAALAFEDPRCLISFDREDEDGELRWHAIGAVSIEAGVDAVVLVAHVYREARDGEEVIRIISARAAETDEIRRYQEQEVE